MFLMTGGACALLGCSSPSFVTNSTGDGGNSADAGGGDSAGDASPNETISSLSLEQVWYITNKSSSDALIDFRTTPVAVTCNGTVGSSDGFEGTAVFTDPETGDLIFYTDGRSVFTGVGHQLLANGSDLNGDASATEPALIAPKNDNSNRRFYIFTNNTNVSSPSGIYYSEIDLDLGTGGTVVNKNVPLLQDGNPGEALDLLPHANGSDFWVLVYDGAATVKAFLVNEAGVSKNAVESNLGLTDNTVKRASINHSYDYKTLALSQNYGSPGGVIATASFNAATGQVSPASVIATGDLGYHASFSEDGTKVYYVRGTEGYLGVAHQFDLLTQTETMLGGTKLAAAKLAPDGKMYWVGHGKTALSVVNNPDAAGAAAGFVADDLSLNGCSSGYGVPNQTAAFGDYLIVVD